MAPVCSVQLCRTTALCHKDPKSHFAIFAAVWEEKEEEEEQKEEREEKEVEEKEEEEKEEEEKEGEEGNQGKLARWTFDYVAKQHL